MSREDIDLVEDMTMEVEVDVVESTRAWWRHQ
jgi:hypothetical protein